MTWQSSGEIGLYLLRGTVNTITLSIAVITLGTALGVGVGLLRFARFWAVRAVIGWLVELVRAVPLLMLLFFTFFGLPAIGIELPTFVSATLALSLWMVVNTSEVVRGAIRSIPRGQAEAASSTGLSGVQTMTYVIFPQALRRMLPPFVGLCTIMIKDSSLAAVIGVFDLTLAAQQMIARTYQAMSIYLITAAIYFCLCYPLSVLARRLEMRMHP